MSKTLGIILARGGSKRIPRKQIATIGDTTLLENCIAIAKRAGLEVVADSDDNEILKVISGTGIPAIRRPKELAGDEISSVDCVLHILQKLKHNETFVLLQCTSPFLSPGDILRAIDLHHTQNKPIFGAKKDSRVWWSWRESRPVFKQFVGVRSQELPPAFMPCGAVYVTKTSWLKKNRSFFEPGALPMEIPPERAIDIDTPLELEFARFLWRQQQLVVQQTQQRERSVISSVDCQSP